MIALLLYLLLTVQGVPPLPAETGVVTGELKTEGGKPAAGVRVAALAKPDSANDLSSVSSFTALTETDTSGRFRLENIPPGPYYIVAGRVDFPTIYPGATSIVSGTIISVSSGKTVAGIDFVLKDSTMRPASSFPSSSFSIPLQVQVENSSKIPLFSSHGFAAIRLDATAAAWYGVFSVGESYVSLPANNLEYRLAVENLPDGFAVKSATYGKINLLTDTLKANGPVQTVVLILTRLDVRPGSGVRVTGRSTAKELHAAAISGFPGTFYSDGSFEFQGVPPGRHTIVAIGDKRNAPIMAAYLVVGSEDIDGVELVSVPVLPEKARIPSPAPVGSRPPGTILRLASIHGQIVEAETKIPVSQGEGFIIGDDLGTFPIDPDGKFEIRNLLPGNYSLAFQMVGYPTIQRTITVGDEDLNIQMVEPN